MQRRRYRRRFRWMATGLTFVLIPVFLAPIVTADSSSTGLRQTEVVTIDLTADGAPGAVDFTEDMRAGFDGLMTVELPATLSDVSSKGAPSMSEQDSDVEFRVDGKGPNAPVDWSVNGRGKLTNSRGTVSTPAGDRQLPLDVETTIRLDDTELGTTEQFDDAAGKSGRFEMEITIQNRAGVVDEVAYKDSATGKEVKQAGFVFIPFTVAIGPWFLDNGNWSNVVVDNLISEQVGEETVVTGAQILAPPTLPGTTTHRLSADVQSFDLNSAKIFAVPGIDAELPQSVQAAQTEGGSRTALIFTALQGFLEAFDTALEPPPEQALPFLAQETGQFAQTAQGAANLLSNLIPSVISTINGLISAINGFDLDQFDDQILDGLATLGGTLGRTTYTQPSCRPDLVPQSLCNLDAWQVPAIPPNSSLPGKGPFAAIAQNPSTGQTELYPRTTSSLGNMVGTPDPEGNGNFTGSIYNWAAFLEFAMERPLDVTGSGTADFPPFVWPNPNTTPELYTKQGIDTVAINAGEIFPGAGTITADGQVFEGVNATFPNPSPVFTGVCSLQLGDIAQQGVWFNEFSVDCTNQGKQIGLPAEDVRLGDILTGSAENKVGTAFARLDACAAKEDPADPDKEIADCDSGHVTLEGNVDFGQMVVQATQRGLENVLLSQPDQWNIECFDFTSENIGLGSITLLGVVQVLCGRDAQLPGPSDLTSTATYNGEGFRSPDVFLDLINIPLPPLPPPFDVFTELDAGIIPFNPAYNEGCFYPLSLFVPGQPGTDTDDPGKLTCDWALHGQLKTTSAWAQAMQDKIYSPAWNFDNWLRGDPGFQLGDQAPTAPGLEQALTTVVPFDLDRGAAECPDVIVTSPGSGTPRVRPPARTASCANVPDTSQPPETLLGDVENIRTAVAGPGGILEAAAVLVASLDPLIPFLEETATNLQFISDTTVELIERLTVSRAIDEQLIAQLATLQTAGDLATAVTQKGIELAKEYEPFMGPATYNGTQADADVILAFEVQGVKL